MARAHVGSCARSDCSGSELSKFKVIITFEHFFFFFFLIRHIKFLHVYSIWPKINELTYFYKFVNPTRNVIKQRGLQKSIAPAQAVQSDLKAWVILYRSNSAQHAGADLHVNNPPQGPETMTGCCSFCSPEEPLASFLSRCCHTILPFLPPFQRSFGFLHLLSWWRTNLPSARSRLSYVWARARQQNHFGLFTI